MTSYLESMDVEASALLSIALWDPVVAVVTVVVAA
jgi:hypothetical protein